MPNPNVSVAHGLVEESADVARTFAFLLCSSTSISQLLPCRHALIIANQVAKISTTGSRHCGEELIIGEACERLNG